MNQTRRLNVCVFTPLGLYGRGGIDRLMDKLRIALHTRTDVKVVFVATRGQWHIALSPVFLAIAIARIVVFKVFRNIDIAHINLSGRGSTYRKLIIAWVLRTFRIPYVVHLHDGDFQAFWENSPRWLDSALRNLFSRSARVIVLGSIWAELIRRKVPAAVNRTTILFNATPAVPLSRYPVARNAPVKLLFLGKLGKQKGVPQFVCALERLASEPGWFAILAGDGEISQTRDDVAHRGLCERVSIPGWVDASDVEILLREADILVLPSFAENLPMSVVEAFAYGIAVVCTPVGALPDIVENERTGLLVEPGNVDELTQAVQRLLRDPDLRNRLGINARMLHKASLEINTYVENLATIWKTEALCDSDK